MTANDINYEVAVVDLPELTNCLIYTPMSTYTQYILNTNMIPTDNLILTSYFESIANYIKLELKYNNLKIKIMITNMQGNTIENNNGIYIDSPLIFNFIRSQLKDIENTKKLILPNFNMKVH